MSKKADAALRLFNTDRITKFLLEQDEDVRRVDNGAIAFPTGDEEGNDSWVVVRISVPTGTRDGEAYDGYSLAEDFEMKQKKDAERKAEAAAKKAKKIARDEAMRAQRKAAKEKEAAKKN